MSDSGDRDAGDQRRSTSFWEDWFTRHADASAASAEQWQTLGQGWRTAVEAWWQRAGVQSSPEATEVLRQAVEQGKTFFELADGVTRSAGDRSAGGDSFPGHDIVWRLPLEVWERAARSALAPRSTRVGHARLADSMAAYQKALSDYANMLRGVGATTLRGVSESWPTRKRSSPGDAGLRELFDSCVEIGEQRYHELVSGEAFAETGGRLLNAYVKMVREWQRAANDDDNTAIADPDTDANESTGAVGRVAETGHGDPESTLNPVELMARLGIAPEQTLAELREFGDKLERALAAFEQIGRIEVGASARETVLRDGKLALYHYLPTTGATNPVPVLIVYALANRPYMMDLEPKRSLIRALLDAGLDVYLVDWGYPDAEDRNLDLADYVVRRLGNCVDTVCRRHDVSSLSLLGVCQGGTFSLCYSALNPEKIHNLVLMVTPVDFHTPDNLLTAWLRHVDVDEMVDVLGNIPGALLNWAFVSMKPLRLTGQKYLDMLDLTNEQEKVKTFLRMEKWIHDSPDQAGECFREFAKELIQQNKLVEGTLRIDDRSVDLGKITMPVLNIYAAYDHIVPPAASLALERHIATTDYTTCEFEGGHIGIYVSARAQREVPGKIADWLHARCKSEPEQSP